VERRLLYLEERRLALLRVALTRLLQKQLVKIGIAAEGISALRIDERLDTARRIAGIAGADHDDAVQFLLDPVPVEGRTLHLPHLDADAGLVEIVHDRIGDGRKAGVRREIAGVDAVRVTR